MQDEYLHDLIERFQQGRCTPQEERLLQEWYAALGQERRLNLTPEQKSALEQDLWQRLAAATIDAGHPVAPAWTVLRAAPVRWAAAAALAMGLGVGAWYYSISSSASTVASVEPVKSQTAVPGKWLSQNNPVGGQPRRIALPDGSVVMLSAGSRLTYPRQFGTGRRTVALVGEGFFQVHHDPAHPFKVYTDKVVTTVLGTSFTVQAYPGQAQGVVQVKTGRVRVSPRVPVPVEVAARVHRPADVIVVANQQAIYRPAQQQLQRTLVAEPVLLQPQPFRFKDRPVAEVLQALEKGYGVPILFDPATLAHCTVTLSLRQDAPLAQKLNILCEALGTTYEESDGHIRFHSAGCAAR